MPWKIDSVYRQKNAPKLPVRLWFGKFSAWKSLMGGRTTEQYYSKRVGAFLDAFPKRKSLEQFTSTDVADFRLLQRKRGYSESVINREICAIRSFWQWLIDQKGLPLRNIAAKVYAPTWHFPKLSGPAPYRTLNEAEKLLAELPSLKAKRAVIGIMQGSRCASTVGKLREEIYAAAARAGLQNFRLVQFKLVTRSPLARDIIKAYCDQLLNALPVEPQPSSNTLTTVKAPTSNEWTTVSDYSNNLPTSGGVTKEQLGAEG